MKLAVILPTRNKSGLCGSAIRAFQHLESAQNEVFYFIRIDSDEANAYGGLSLMPSVCCIYDNAPPTPAEKVMDIINCRSFKEFDPDAHVLMSDDVLPLTFQWDAYIAGAIEQGHDAFCWQEASDPKNTGYIVLSKKYVGRMPSYLPLWFPFWFSDNWRAEVHFMAFGKPMPIITNLCLGGKRGKTYGMQDLEFWFDFFIKTRRVRIREAEQMAKNWDIPFNLNMQILSHFEKCDAEQKTRYELYENSFAGNPSPLHAEAKKRAQDFLNQGMI